MIITKPTVHLIGKQVVDDAELGRFLDSHDVGNWQTDTEIGGEKLVEVAGRVCYMSFAKPRPGGNKAYVDHILEVGHGSVLEHAVFSLLITGLSRSLTHELVRHRAGFGYSQLSQRFVDESDCEFVEPQVIAEDPELHQIWLEAVASAQESYKKLSDGLAAKLAQSKPKEIFFKPVKPADGMYVKQSDGFAAKIIDTALHRKRAREAARSVLPNATETKIFMTGNARAWRHFIEMRGSIHADAEIQRLAVAVLDKLRDAAPNLFGDYVVQDGSIETQFRKV